MRAPKWKLRGRLHSSNTIGLPMFSVSLNKEGMTSNAAAAALERAANPALVYAVEAILLLSMDLVQYSSNASSAPSSSLLVLAFASCLLGRYTPHMEQQCRHSLSS